MIECDAMQGARQNAEREIMSDWMQGHIEAEVRMGGSIAAVRSEYQDCPAPVPCLCGGQAHYRATIGGMKCLSCSSLYWADGDLIADRRTK